MVSEKPIELTEQPIVNVQGEEKSSEHVVKKLLDLQEKTNI